MPKEAVSVTPIPVYEDWLSMWTAKNHDTELLTDPTLLPALYAGVASRDFTLIRVDGQVGRYCRVPEADVFYQIGRKRYRIRETGYTINSDRRSEAEKVLEEVKSGDMQGVTLSRVRANGNSISERGKLNGETREEATIRMISEELFETSLHSASEDAYPDLEQIIQENLSYSDSYVSRRGPSHPLNSFKGIPVVYFMHPAAITFTPEMDVPVLVEENLPQSLYELEEGKYINVYSWERDRQITRLLRRSKGAIKDAARMLFWDNALSGNPGITMDADVWYEVAQSRQKAFEEVADHAGERKKRSS